MRVSSVAAGLLALGMAATNPAAWAQEPDAIIAAAERSVRGRLADQVAYEALIAQAPDTLTVTIEGYEEEGRGVVARGVRIASATTPDLALTIDALRTFGLEPGALAALAGPGGEGQRLARRIDARGVAVTGLAEAMNAVFDQTTALAMEAADAAMPQVEQTVEAYELAMARVVADDLSLFGTDAMIEDGADGAALRRYAELARSYELDRFVAFDTTLALRMTQVTTVPAVTASEGAEDGEAAEAASEPTTSTTRTAMSGTIPATGMAGYERGDIESQFVRALSLETSSTTVEADLTIPYQVELAEAVYTDIRLSDALGYLAAWTVPPPEETDLLSLGRSVFTGVNVQMAGAPFQTIERAVLDLTSWHGLLPKKITYQSQESLSLDGFLALAEESAAAASPEEQAALGQLGAVRGLLAEAGLDTIAFENASTYEWSPEDGRARLDIVSVSPGLGTLMVTNTGALPPYEGFAAIDPASLGDDSSPLSALMGEASSLDRFELVLDDQGVIDRVLGAALAWAALPENAENPQTAMLAGQDVTSLRVMASAGVSMATAQLAAAAPQVRDYATALAVWVREGGKLRVVVDPSEPLDAEAVDALSAMPGGPAGTIDALGLTVTHEASEAAE